ncbi:MAG: TonB-dependent receptor, partial [Bacteroidales bacterium]|nr:TonB-dependent receptor [Bacteroidales bacterium]
MLRKLFFTLGLLLTTSVVLYSQGVLTGTITDASTKEPLPFVNVIAEQNGQQMGGATTDIDGNYQIKPLAPGDYDIKASYMGYKTVLKTGVKVNASGFSRGGNIEMSQTSEMLDVVEIVEYAIPLLESGTSESGKRISAEELDKMTANSVDAIIANVGGITDSDGGAGSARGEGSMVTYVNGVAKKGSVNIPKTAIAEIQVILGGTPASIGEAIGGSTNITLKPPQNEFQGFVQYQTSELMDTRGYHRGDFYFTGPLWKKKDESGATNSVIGYRLSGFVTYSADPYIRPKDRRYYMIKDNVLENLRQNPLVYDPSTGA